MNERILTLADQAVKDMVSPGHVNIPDEFCINFAKLIIKECTGMFADDLRSMEDYTGKACRYMIKEHFGITE